MHTYQIPNGKKLCAFKNTKNSFILNYIHFIDLTHYLSNAYSVFLWSAFIPQSLINWLNYQQHQQQKLSFEMREGRSRKNKINTSIQMHIVNHFTTNQIQKIQESIWISEKDASDSNTFINYWLINYHLKRVTSRNTDSFE